MTSRRNGSNLLRVCTYARQPTLQYSKKTKKQKQKGEELITQAFVIQSRCSTAVTLITVYHHFQMALMMAYAFRVAPATVDNQPLALFSVARLGLTHFPGLPLLSLFSALCYISF